MLKIIMGVEDRPAKVTIEACLSDKRCQRYEGILGNKKLFCLITAGYRINLF
jgi:hypothetical protein